MESLDHIFKNLVLEWIDELRKRNLCIEIRQAYISPKEQAKLWKSGHSDSEIDQAIQYLIANDCNTMADLIIEADGTVGPFVTKSFPGCSWHNWRTAMTYNLQKIGECKPLSLHNPEYKISTRWARKIGLYAGDTLEPVRLKPDLIQQSKYSNPLDCYSLKQIDDKLKEWYEQQTD